jgi:hypothetical protein
MGIFAQMADPSLFDQQLARPSSPYFSIASSGSSLALPPRLSLARSCGMNLRAVLLHLGKVCLKVELGVVRVGYYCASNVSMRRVARLACQSFFIASVLVPRTTERSLPHVHIPTALDTR